MVAVLVCWVLGAGGVLEVYDSGLTMKASSCAGDKYTADKAVDGSAGTRWACADGAALPQWIEVALPKVARVDMVRVEIPVDALYAAWKDVELTFSTGEPLRYSLGPDDVIAEWRFEPRETAFVRVTVLSAHAAKHYVGVKELLLAHDPKRKLWLPTEAERPVRREDLVIRGRTVHPCVSVTQDDVRQARERVERYAWAREERDSIVAEADRWLEETDEYWLGFLPKPGACYAYGFTACPICNGRTGTWVGANCTWDNPGHVKCANGHVLPDTEHPDDGQGYAAPDGRIHYFVGQYNAWVTEQWTLKALPALSQAYLLTGDERYAQRGALLLDALASIYSESTSGSWDYPSDPPSGRFARPWYQVARTLVKYVDQYDFLYNSPALDEASLRPGMTRRENIEQHMLLDGAYYCYGHSFDGALHNGHADYMRGALAVGCLLDIPEFIRIAVAGPFSIHAMLANNIDRDGRYYETALGYAIHARLLYLTFADPLCNLRNAEYPEGENLYDDARMASCLLLPELQVQLAGRLPNFGDAAPDVVYKPYPERPFSAVDYGFLERLYAMTSDEERRDAYGTALLWLADGDVDAQRAASRYRSWLLWHAKEPPAETQPLPTPLSARVNGSWVAGMKGMAMLRSGMEAALVRFGPSLNHGDPDDLGLLYYANGYELTYDLGYGLGSTHCHVGWASSTVSHCLVTVNEKNQLEGPGSGGSLRFFGNLPHVKVVEATSEASYSAENVSEYRRTVALVDGAYLVDVFRVVGGSQHDYGFGSIGTDLDPFGVEDLAPREGSLTDGFEWGNKVGPDGDIVGHPNKPYWNPPPGNGYGFFRNVRAGQPSGVWGGTWTIPGDPGTKLRMHVAGDAAEALFADAPGLYPNKPDASYVLARRKGGNLDSVFVTVYEPFTPAGTETEALLAGVRRLGRAAVEVRRVDGTTDVLLAGDCDVDCAYGHVRFRGAFAMLTGDGKVVSDCETVGADQLVLGSRDVETGPVTFEASVTAVDASACVVELAEAPPADIVGQVVVFSNPAYSRTTAYHVRASEGRRLTLEASSLVLGVGRVAGIVGSDVLLSDIPHEYAKTVKRAHSTRFFQGKTIRGANGGQTRVRTIAPGSPMRVTVDDATVFSPHERFEYLDIVVGDTATIPLVRARSL